MFSKGHSITNSGVLLDLSNDAVKKPLRAQGSFSSNSIQMPHSDFSPPQKLHLAGQKGEPCCEIGGICLIAPNKRHPAIGCENGNPGRIQDLTNKT